MPMTSPCRLTSGPPELPGLILASVWMYSRMRSPDMCTLRVTLPLPLMMPAVTL
jgi:hypothetical protein